MRSRLLAAAVLTIAIPGAGGASIPDAVPDLPVAGAQPLRGAGLVTSPAPAIAPAVKTIDGDVSDWTGTPTRFGGTAVYSAGEYVYQDYVMDDWGADDGQDAARVQHTDALAEAEPRTYRTEALAQALGEQFGVRGNETIAAEARYGDAAYPAAYKDHADIEEVRVAADPERLVFLVRTTGMIHDPGTAVLILIDTEPGGSYDAQGVSKTEAEWAFVAAGDRLVISHKGTALSRICQIPCPPPTEVVATDASGFVNAMEISIGRSLFTEGLPERLEIAVASGVVGPSGTGFATTRQGDAKSDLFNVAFRFDEPVRIWNDHDQALALRDGDIDRYLTPVSLSRLESGYTETFTPRPGYWEKIYETDSPVNGEFEDGQYFQGAFQHYGVYLPTAYRAGTPSPATWWTHYRGGHAHDAAAWVPGLIRQLGEQRGNIVISPGARGTSSWYVGRGHEDFLDAWDDAMASFSIDPDRVYLSGYSMGGFASYLLGLLYPDRWAAVSPTAGPPTQGLWDGVGLVNSGVNDGRAADELTFNIVENARNLPYVIYHGTDDELVPVTGALRMGTRFAELGYRYRFYLFPGYEHYTAAVVDEWGESARYFDQFRRDPNPPRVTYRVWPAIERAVEQIHAPAGALDYSFDGAYWVDGLVIRNEQASATGTFDGVTYGRGVPEVVALPEGGTANAVVSPPAVSSATTGQSTPYVMHGLRWNGIGSAAPANRFVADLKNLAEATLDLARMGLSSSETLSATITSDGVTTITLRGSWLSTPSVSGASVVSFSNGTLAIAVGSGASPVTIAPA